jgi:hypothetical protein
VSKQTLAEPTEPMAAADRLQRTRMRFPARPLPCRCLTAAEQACGWPGVRTRGSSVNQLTALTIADRELIEARAQRDKLPKPEMVFNATRIRIDVVQAFPQQRASLLRAHDLVQIDGFFATVAFSPHRDCLKCGGDQPQRVAIISECQR